MNEILIVGALPPPVGGVALHIDRLTKQLAAHEIPYRMCDLRHDSKLEIISKLWHAKLIHIHTGNTYICFAICLFAFLTGKKTIITRHGDITRISRRRRWFNLGCIRLCHTPILLNQESFELARKYNQRAKLCTSFIPPVGSHPLPDETNNILAEAKSRDFQAVFATNSSGFCLDTHGRETYGITGLIEFFRRRPKWFLIAAVCNDTTGKHLLSTGITLPDNVRLIEKPIDFFELLKATDGSIRNTSTDGDALSVREALFLHKPVFATDCVGRPAGTVLYHSLTELAAKIEAHLDGRSPVLSSCDAIDSTQTHIDLYKSLLK